MADNPGGKPPEKTNTPQDEPLIRLGEYWIPAHMAWKKMEAASIVADVIDHYNTHFPHLANKLTLSTVPLVRKRLKEVQLRISKPAEQIDVGSIAGALLDQMAPEDVLDELLRAHKQELNLRELIAAAGEEPYLRSLQREAMDYLANQISADQTALIWNEMQRPPPGGGLWTQRKVERLIDGEGLV